MKISTLAAAVIAAAVLSMVNRASADTIAAWQYSTTESPPVNTLPPTGGVLAASASATQLGMTNNYTYAAGEGPGSSANCDINVPGPGNEVGWRIRGNSNSKNSGSGEANGWNSSAPQYDGSSGAYADTTGAPLNNSSENWGLNNIVISGVAETVPEPSTIALAAGGTGFGLLRWSRRGRPRSRRLTT
jgi:hypothetical protein